VEIEIESDSGFEGRELIESERLQDGVDEERGGDKSVSEHDVMRDRVGGVRWK
jgi:hypothetical protein